MKSRVVNLGQARGVRILKKVLGDVGLSGHVEIRVEGERVVIQRPAKPRAGWAEAAREIAEEDLEAKT